MLGESDAPLARTGRSSLLVFLRRDTNPLALGLLHGPLRSISRATNENTRDNLQNAPRARRPAAGLLHESLGHECLKRLLAFRKPAVAVVSRCPARTEGL